MRGFFTDPSRADDSFIPFNGDISFIPLGNSEEGESDTQTATFNFSLAKNSIVLVLNCGGSGNYSSVISATNCDIISQTQIAHIGMIILKVNVSNANQTVLTTDRWNGSWTAKAFHVANT